MAVKVPLTHFNYLQCSTSTKKQIKFGWVFYFYFGFVYLLYGRKWQYVKDTLTAIENPEWLNLPVVHAQDPLLLLNYPYVLHVSIVQH